MVADILTNPLGKDLHYKFVKALGIVSLLLFYFFLFFISHNHFVTDGLC